MKIRVYYEDTDAEGIVYYANYFKFCERARSEIFFQAGAKPQKGECHFVVSKVEADYKGSAELGDILEVSTQPERIGKVYLILKQEIKKDKKTIFSMKIKLAFLCKGKPSIIPREFLDLFRLET